MAEETAKNEAGEAAEGDAAVPPKSGKKSDLMIVVIVGLLVIVLTPLATFFVVKKAAPPSEEDAEKEALVVEGDILGFDLKPVNVNIAQTKGTRFLRLDVTLVVSEPGMVEELKKYNSLLTDRVILAASRRTIDELEGPKGREALKRDIISEVNAAIKGRINGAVTDVYFKEFLIQ